MYIYFSYFYFFTLLLLFLTINLYFFINLLYTMQQTTDQWSNKEDRHAEDGPSPHADGRTVNRGHHVLIDGTRR